MDVLYFIKEEYAAVKAAIPALVGGDTTGMLDDELRAYLKLVGLTVRVADELVLPELADQAKRDLLALAEAGDQTSELLKIVTSGLKSGRLGDARRRELANLMTEHLDFMERVVLPRFREEIATQTREELGLVALDFKADIGVVAWASSETRRAASQ